VLLSTGPSSYPYSPECVEGAFPEVRIQEPAHRPVRAPGLFANRPARASPLHAPCSTVGWICGFLHTWDPYGYA
jgi:hypothetical protein